MDSSSLPQTLKDLESKTNTYTISQTFYFKINHLWNKRSLSKFNHSVITNQIWKFTCQKFTNVFQIKDLKISVIRSMKKQFG